MHCPVLPLRFTRIVAASYRPSGLVRHLRGLKEVSLYGHRGHDFSRLRRSVKIVRIMVRFRQLVGWQLLRGGQTELGGSPCWLKHQPRAIRGATPRNQAGHACCTAAGRKLDSRAP